MYTEDVDDPMEDTVFVSFFTLDFKVSIYTQVQSYIFEDFVADIGGYLGLLLGASLWSVYGMATSACQRLAGKIDF